MTCVSGSLVALRRPPEPNTLSEQRTRRRAFARSSCVGPRSSRGAHPFVLRSCSLGGRVPARDGGVGPLHLLARRHVARARRPARQPGDGPAGRDDRPGVAAVTENDVAPSSRSPPEPWIVMRVQVQRRPPRARPVHACNDAAARLPFHRRTRALVALHSRVVARGVEARVLHMELHDMTVPPTPRLSRSRSP